MRRQAYPRALGFLTAAYGAYVLLRPQALTRTADLEPGPEVSRSGRALARVVGGRDVLSGVAMMLAPSGTALRAAVAARVASDATDALGFGLAVPPRSRAKVVAVTAGWALLCATAWRTAGASR